MLELSGSGIERHAQEDRQGLVINQMWRSGRESDSSVNYPGAGATLIQDG